MMGMPGLPRAVTQYVDHGYWRGFTTEAPGSQRYWIVVITHGGSGGKQRFGAVFIRPPITSATSL